MGKNKSFVMLRRRTPLGYELTVNTAKFPAQARQDRLRTVLLAGIASRIAQQKDHDRTEHHRAGQAKIFTDSIHI